jgi:mannose-6-phosphate isomerase-like protein (cupin superfamily)
MTPTPVCFQEKLARITEPWKPRIVARMNDCHFKLVKLSGEFVWHRHEETDEAFIALEGEFAIAFRDRTVALKAGEMLVVPRGVEHKPVAERECSVLLVEPAGTVNTGDAGGEMTAPADDWI